MSENDKRKTKRYPAHVIYNEEWFEEVLSILEETGDYRNVVICHGLKASFLVESKNYLDCVLHISFSFGNGGGPTLDIPKTDIGDDPDKQLQTLEKILTNKLRSCVRDFSPDEIKLVARIGLHALKNSVAYNASDEMSLEKVIAEIYYFAYKEKRKYTHDVVKQFEKYVPAENDSLATITLIDDSRYGECICINDKRNVFDRVLEYIGCNWSALELKKKLRDRGFLVTDNGNPYCCLIQTKKAKEIGVRKIVKIPTKRVEAFIKPIKEEIEAENIRKIEIQKKIEETKKSQLDEEALKRDQQQLEKQREKANQTFSRKTEEMRKSKTEENE